MPDLSLAREVARRMELHIAVPVGDAELIATAVLDTKEEQQP